MMTLQAKFKGNATMLEEAVHGTDSMELENLRSAADLLRNGLAELRTLAINNARLSYSLAATGASQRQLLDMLTGTIELLAVARDTERAHSLRQRARALTARLVAEMDVLARVAHYDFEWDW
jgi:hypothetical protein